MKAQLEIVISSTARDLPEHRQEVMVACQNLGCVPKMMEHLPAVDADAIRASFDLVDQADVYVGVFANRYGYVPKGYECSITEMELQRAEEQQIPRLIFLIDDDHPVSRKDVDTGDGAEKLSALKARLVSERMVQFGFRQIFALAVWREKFCRHWLYSSQIGPGSMSAKISALKELPSRWQMAMASATSCAVALKLSKRCTARRSGSLCAACWSSRTIAWPA
jgi:hypothetical protein